MLVSIMISKGTVAVGTFLVLIAEITAHDESIEGIHMAFI
jgi:hypothetical protein